MVHLPDVKCECSFCSVGAETKITVFPVPCIPSVALVRAHLMGVWKPNQYFKVLLSYEHSRLLFEAVSGKEFTLHNLVSVCDFRYVVQVPKERQVSLEKAVLWFLTLTIPLINVVRLVTQTPCVNVFDDENLRCGSHWMSMLIGVQRVMHEWVGEMSPDLKVYFTTLADVSAVLCGLLFALFDETILVTGCIIYQKNDPQPYLHLKLTPRPADEVRPFVILPKAE